MNIKKEQNFISAVIYVKNNAATIAGMLDHVYEKMNALFENFEIICVNDASEDESRDIIREKADGFGCAVTIVDMGYSQGMELSMAAGEDMAIGDFVYEFERTYVSWPDDMIERVYRKMQGGYDIISACPEKSTPLSSRIFYHVFNRYSNVKAKIGTESFRLISRRAINRVASMNTARMYRKAVNANTGLKQTTIRFMPVGSRTGAGVSKKERRALAVDSLILFTNIGYKVSLIMSVIMLIFAAVVGIYTVVIYITGHPVAGWTPIMIFLAIGFFVLFAILTFVIKYLSLILNLNLRRAHYVVEDVEKL